LWMLMRLGAVSLNRTAEKDDFCHHPHVFHQRHGWPHLLGSAEWHRVQYIRMNNVVIMTFTVSQWVKHLSLLDTGMFTSDWIIG
jgi:hypothetical protein